MADDNVIKGKFYPRGERVIKGKGKEVFAQIKAEKEAYERAHGITSEEKKTSMRKKKPGNIKKKPGNMKKAPSLDDLTKKAKQALVRNPNIGKTALTNMLRTKNVPVALALTAGAIAYDYFKNNKGEGKTPSASERKAARHGKEKKFEGMQSLKDQALKASKPPKKKESTRKKAARRQGRGMAHGGPVKSKYSTSNKRYSNGGKIYPR